MCVYVWVWVCVCVCLTQLSYKRITSLKCPFFMIRNGQFLRDWKASLYMNVCEAHPCVCFSLLLIHSGWSVLLLRRNLVKENKGVWRRRIYRKYASCRWLKNAGLEFTRRRSFKHVTWSSWSMVSRDWILSVRHLCGNKWHTAQNNL